MVAALARTCARCELPLVPLLAVVVFSSNWQPTRLGGIKRRRCARTECGHGDYMSHDCLELEEKYPEQSYFSYPGLLGLLSFGETFLGHMITAARLTIKRPRRRSDLKVPNPNHRPSNKLSQLLGWKPMNIDFGLQECTGLVFFERWVG